MRVYKLFDTLQICLIQRFVSLSGYGCCAFGGAPLLQGCTLSHWFERQARLYRKKGAGGKAAVSACCVTAN